MSTVGKVCLVITILLLLVAFLPIPGPWGGWTPKLLVIHNQWSEKFRDAKQKTQDAMRSHDLARQELSKATADIEGQTVGWGRFWTIPARGPNNAPDAPQISVMNDGRLRLANLGASQGLQPLPFDDDANNSQTAAPVVHAFVASAEGFTYAGEFNATETNATGATLTPAHGTPDVNFLRSNVNSTWRLRTMVPPALRLSIDELYQHNRRTFEATQRTIANITRQQELKTAAEVAYQTRRGELLGVLNPKPEDVVSERPEFTQGLLQVIEQTEEQRNQLQLNVDSLRRDIKTAIREQSEYLESLNDTLLTMPGATTNFAKAANSTAE